MAEHAGDNEIVYEELRRDEPVVEIVDDREAQREALNQGEEPIAARREIGSEARDTIVRCRKINRPEDGLFAIAQSEQGQMSVHAALIAREALANHLGESLDEHVRNLGLTDQEPSEQIENIDQHMEDVIKVAFTQIAHELSLQTKLVSGLDRMSVKPVVAKTIDLPDGRKRMYIGHTGDNRVFVVRDGRMIQVTEDQGGLMTQLRPGFISPEQHQRIDQAVDPSRLSDYEAQFFSMRDTNNVPSVQSNGEPTPAFIPVDVQPGDRVVIVNSGLHHNMLTSEMQDILDAGRDDRVTERSMQRFADNEVGKANPRGRSEAGKEIAAIVHTIPEGRRDKWGNEQERERQEMIMQLEAQAAEHEQAVKELGIHRLRATEAQRQKIDLQVASRAYQIERARMGIVDQQIPPRQGIGDTVQLQVDGEQVYVVDYDEKTHRYTLQRENGEELQKTRWQIEPIQPGFMPVVGDVVPIFEKDSGSFDPGYRVMKLGKDGTVILRKGDERPVSRNIREIRGNLIRELRNKDVRAREAAGHAREYHKMRHMIEKRRKAGVRQARKQAGGRAQ